MDSVTDGCRPAAYVLSVSKASCSECPFPFCVVAEASVLRTELREHLLRVMQKLGSSVEEIARAMDVSKRSAYRYKNSHEDAHCYWCNLTHSQHVMCKSNIYSVVCMEGQYSIVLNGHRHATLPELKVIEYFTDYVFPSSVPVKGGDGHDCWLLTRVELEEAKSFEHMCDALNKYTLSLSGDVRCLQRVR